MMNSVGNADHTTGLTPPPLLHDHAPDFVTRTTMGERQLSSYRGRWLVFFSIPPISRPFVQRIHCFAKAYPQFQAAGCDLLALSVDSLFSHLAWARNIQQQFGIEIPFPIARTPDCRSPAHTAWCILPPIAAPPFARHS